MKFTLCKQHRSNADYFSITPGTPEMALLYFNTKLRKQLKEEKLQFVITLQSVRGVGRRPPSAGGDSGRSELWLQLGELL